MRLKYFNFITVLILTVFPLLLNSQIISKVEISGTKQISIDKIRPLIKSRWQARLDTLNLEADRKAIENYYFEEGFLEARCKTDIQLNNKSTIANIQFIIHEGSLYFFGEIFFSGLQNLDQDFVHKLLDIENGQRFSREKIIKSQLRAISTGLFNDIEIKMQDIDTEKKLISVIVVVIEKKKHASHLGTGFDTEDGAKVFFEWKNRNINGRGFGVSTNSFASADYINSVYFKHGSFGVSVFDPYIFYLPIDWKLSLLYNNDKPKYVNFGIENYIAEMIFFHNLSNIDQISLRFRIQKDRIFNATFQTKNKKFINLFMVDDNRYVGISYERDQRDDMIDPSAGIYFYSYLENAGGFLGGNNKFIKLIFNLNNYYNIFRQFVIANKINIGSIESGDPSSIPSYLRLFLGGSGSLRGYPERSVGPKNPDGSAQGGNFLFLNNFEIRYYLSYKFNLVGFVDTGNIWEKRIAARINTLYWSSGLGARYRTKFGFFRLDFGLQLNELPEKYIGKIHFGFGQSF